MDFHWSPDDIAFRRDLRRFFRENLPQGWMEGLASFDDGDSREEMLRGVIRQLADRGWLCNSWPVEYGGRGWGPMRQTIFQEELAYHKMPLGLYTTGINRMGPSIITHATPDQKRRFLPPIARGDVIWAQLFSEPDTGSDLAGIQTKAVDEGDHFRVSGIKVWNRAHKAQWAGTLVRTNPSAPRHAGISYLLLDLSLPGIVVRPVVNMCNAHVFNEVFLDNVIVPKDCLLGQKDQGWRVASHTLTVERTFVNHSVMAQQYYDEMLDVVEGRRDSRKRSLTPQTRARLAQIAVELKVSRLLCYRIAYRQERNLPVSYETAISKLFVSEMTQRLADAAMSLFGLQGQLEEGSPRAPLRGKPQMLYRAQRAITIGGGTSEIMRNVIAKRGLGL
ncbi:MAG: hypothetical protein FJ039_09790 [Chloroflexi bacterium]|nr:hypothetical protein [Chloroflexota bacterium]